MITLNTLTGNVDEDGLAIHSADAGRLGEVTGTNSAVSTGSLASLASFGADGPGAFTLDSSAVAIKSLTDQHLSSDGVALTYSVVGNTLTASSGTTPVFTLDVASGGNYKFTLISHLDHPTLDNVNPGTNGEFDNAENSMKINFGALVKVTDKDGDSVNLPEGNFAIKVQDDIPIAFDINKSTTVSTVPTNLTIVLDLSGSMEDLTTVLDPSHPAINDPNHFYTRLEMEKNSANALIDKYAEQGQVNVFVAGFANTTIPGSGLGWMNVADAKAAVNALQIPVDNGNFERYTNYDQGLDAARGGYNAANKANLLSGQDVLYFMSDGVPNKPDNSAGVNATEQANWENFLKGGELNSAGEKITAFALGMGPDIAGNAGALNPIAYDGVTSTDPANHTLIVGDFNQLNSVLLSTVITPPVTGNLLTDPNPVDGSFGADGGWVQQLVVNGNAYTYDKPSDAHSAVPANAPAGTSFDDVNNVWTIKTATGGTFVVNMVNGDYVYTPPTNAVQGLSENMLFTFTDRDGDAATANLHIGVDVTLVAPDDNDAKVFENALDTARDGADLVASTFTGSLPASTGETDASNQLNATGGTGTLTYALVSPTAGTYGTIQLNANGSYTYTLSKPVTTAPAADNGAQVESGKDAFTYQVTDGAGHTAQGRILVDIVDDVPTARVDTNTVAEGSLLTVAAAAGVLTNDTSGADGYAAGGGVVGVRAAGGDTTTAVTSGVNTNIVGQFGTLHLNADGSYTYQSNANSVTTTATDRFVYTIRDGDGDLSTTTLTITINDSGISTVTGRVQVDEAALDTIQSGADLAASTVTGSNPALTTETASGQLTLGVGVTVVAGLSQTGTFGVLSVNAAGAFTYTLTKPQNSGAVVGPNVVTDAESFTVTIRDANGNTSTGAIKVDIKDDVPTARSDVDYAHAGGTTGGNVLAGTDSDVVGAINNDGAKQADSLGADGASIASIQSAAIPANSDTTFDADGFLSIVGTYGTLQMKGDGTYVYTANADNNPTDYSPKVDVFNYTLRDGDGDTSTTTLTINVKDPVFVVGKNANDTTSNTTDTHQVDVNTTTTGIITGRDTNDILVGDVGGSSVQGKKTNVVLILDVSGSMAKDFQGHQVGDAAYSGPSRLQAMKDGVNAMLETLAASGATDVRVHLNSFSDTINAIQTFDLVAGGAKNTVNLTAAHSFINGLSSGGYTNYEAGLQEALNWVGNGPLTGANVVNQAIFVSDGEPNRALGGTIDPATNAPSLASSNVTTFDDALTATGWNAALRQVVDVPGGVLGGGALADGTSEPALIESRFGRLDAIGINVQPENMTRLSLLEGSAASAGGNDGATNATNAAGFNSALQSVSPTTSLAGVGGDSITGGAGNDLIFGDALNTDVLGVAKGLGLAAGSGWAVFNTLETTPAQNWTRTDTLNYIRTHTDELSVESSVGGVKRTGGNDTIDGGAGNDTIYGQEGNDIIIGGKGNDILNGGSGADTFKWNSGDQGTAAAPAVDTVIGFKENAGDKLDLSDLLPGGAHSASDLSNLFLKFTSTNSGADTTVEVFSSGNANVSGASPDQKIVLQGVVMNTLGANNTDIITTLLNNGKLVDG